MEDNSTIKKSSLNRGPETGRAPLREISTDGEFEKLDERILTALQAAGEKKAIDLVVLHLRGIATFTDYFVITSGANQRQVQAISDEVVGNLKQAGTPAARVEGYQSAEWILLDYGDFIVHVFSDKSRTFYDLERLWRDGQRVRLSGALANESTSFLRRES